MQIKLKVSQILSPDNEGKVPECVLEGTVSIDMPSYVERQKFASGLGLEAIVPTGGLKKMSDDDKVKQGLELQKINAKAAEVVLGYVVECNLTNKEDGTKLTTKDEFMCHPDASPLVEGLVFKFVTNFASKKTKPSPSSK